MAKIGTREDEDLEPRGHEKRRHRKADGVFVPHRWFRLPADARSLGGEVRDGIGEYYRQLLAPQRIVERNGSGDWVARYDEGNRPDHFAHAEAYCLAAFVVRQRGWHPRTFGHFAPTRATR